MRVREGTFTNCRVLFGTWRRLAAEEEEKKGATRSGPPLGSSVSGQMLGTGNPYGYVTVSTSVHSFLPALHTW
jgi:hypothetical protein